MANSHSGNKQLALCFWILVTLVAICVYVLYLFPAKSKDVEVPQFKDRFVSYKDTMFNRTQVIGGLRPMYEGWQSSCGAVKRPLQCPGWKNCIRVSVIGACGDWNTRLRDLPTTFSCPNIKDTVVLQHVDKPSGISVSSIVLFSLLGMYLDVDVWRDLREYRPSDQMWVFQTKESPYYTRGLLPPRIFRNDSFDISNTYQSIANIYSPYGYYQPFRNEESNHILMPLVDFVEKTHFIVWIASHCENLQWDRKAFVKDLQQKINLDILYKCGNESFCKRTWDANCTNKVDQDIKSYKFILALENSCCEDYMTENLWHSLTIGVVPVVIGPRIDNYIKLAPPGSFIHIDQFESALNLKRYLEYLDENNTAYLEYFQWKTKGTVQEHSIKEHYQNHLSDNTICAITEQYLERKRKSNEETDSNANLEMFDPYGPRWKGTCHRCGEHQWIREYEFPPDHVWNAI